MQWAKEGRQAAARQATAKILTGAATAAPVKTEPSAEKGSERRTASLGATEQPG